MIMYNHVHFYDYKYFTVLYPNILTLFKMINDMILSLFLFSFIFFCFVCIY